MTRKQTVLIMKKAIESIQGKTDAYCIEEWARFVGVEIPLGRYVQRQARNANVPLAVRDYDGFDGEIERFMRWATLVIYAAIRESHHRVWQIAMEGDDRLAALVAEVNVGEPWEAHKLQSSIDERLVEQCTLDEAIAHFPPGVGHRLRWLADAEPNLAFFVENQIRQFGGLALASNGVDDDVIEEVESVLEEVFATIIEAARRAHYARWTGTPIGLKLVELDAGLAERVRNAKGREGER